jgi:hypothetical protein
MQLSLKLLFISIVFGSNIVSSQPHKARQVDSAVVTLVNDANNITNFLAISNTLSPNQIVDGAKYAENNKFNNFVQLLQTIKKDTNNNPIVGNAFDVFNGAPRNDVIQSFQALIEAGLRNQSIAVALADTVTKYCIALKDLTPVLTVADPGVVFNTTLCPPGTKPSRKRN